MGFEALLRFDGDGCYDTMAAKFETVIGDLCQTILANAQANLGGLYPEVAATLHAGLVSLAQTGLIEGRIGTDHWEAWIAEWGSGSEMDKSNPDLAAYMSSQYWNPVRNGLSISGRPKGMYLGLDGEMHYSGGKSAGLNLEWLSLYDEEFKNWMLEHGLDEDAFQPKPALHFMRLAMRSNRALIMDQLNAVLETFHFSDFLV